MTNERDNYEKNHRKKKIILRTVGIVLVLGGLAAAIYGFVDMGLAFSGNDFRVPKFWQSPNFGCSLSVFRQSQ